MTTTTDKSALEKLRCIMAGGAEQLNTNNNIFRWNLSKGVGTTFNQNNYQQEKDEKEKRIIQ